MSNLSILEQIVIWVTTVISTLGYPGIFLLMTLESALIPIPSEVIMPFSGFLVSQGRFGLAAVVLIGALGNLCGSWIAYGLGYWGHKTVVKKLISKYGKFILLTEDEYENALRLFAKYGQWITALARVLPVLRTVISLPAGVAKLPFWKFSFLTFGGSLIWSLFLASLGFILGSNWQIIRPYFSRFEVLIVGLVVVLVGFYIYRKVFKVKFHEKSS